MSQSYRSLTTSYMRTKTVFEQFLQESLSEAIKSSWQHRK